MSSKVFEVTTMAKLYRTNSNLHPLCYALQQSEDAIIAGALLDLEYATLSTARQASVLNALKLHWLSNGNGLSDRILLWLNDIRRIEGRPEIRFVDGHSTTYSLRRGEEKATERKRILEALRRLRVGSPTHNTQTPSNARRSWQGCFPRAIHCSSPRKQRDMP